MKATPLYPICFLFCLQCLAQQDCSHPYNVIICPGICITNQTNEGLGDDAPASCNITGEDATYCVQVPNGATALFISIQHASAPLLLIVEHDACLNNGCTSMNVPAGDTNVTFHDTAQTFYNVWVDAPVGVTYDICFGADTGIIFISQPNTQGNLRYDSSLCSVPFSNNKPYVHVTYNNITQTNPMTLPLLTMGTLCITTYFKNTTGIEGVKQFKFTFHSGGFSSVSAVTASFPGFYNAGTWTGTNAGNVFTFNFADAAGLGKGDFSPPPNTCLAYTFCFHVIPVSNNHDSTNVRVQVLSDGFGAAFSGWVHSGCCPSPFANCLGSSAWSSGGSHSFSFDIADPGSALPVTLVSFDASVQKQSVQLKWETMAEVNNDYFSVERSPNTGDWSAVARITGAGNTVQPRFYHYTDESALPGLSYYRLRQTDYDGHFSYSDVRYVQVKDKVDITVFPNPTKGIVTILYDAESVSAGLSTAELKIFNAMGSIIYRETMQGSQQSADLSAQPKGIYFLQLIAEGYSRMKKIVVE